jgi:hypothetical protein
MYIYVSPPLGEAELGLGGAIFELNEKNKERKIF